MSGINEIKCLNKNCSINNDDERLIVCWLCHGLCHFKCCGLPVLIAESLSKHKGLHWCCNNCRKIGVDFYRFFQGTKTNFHEIQKEVSALSDRISTYSKLFEDYNSLNVLNSPPQSSPKRRKSSRNANKPITFSDPVSSAPSISTNKPEPIKSPIPNLSEQLVNSNESVNQPNVAEKNHESVNQPNVADKNHEAVHSMEFDGEYHPETLKVIPPNKSIFISRFSYDTSAEQIDAYIKYKLKKNPVINVKKFTYSQPREITSFKVTVPADLFNEIKNPNFWPKHSLVREYIFKENTRLNNIAQLPLPDETTSKN